MDNEKRIKTLTESKAKELSSINSFCRDYGLSDAHASSGNKGLGTIGSVVREMADKNYDPGKVNKFDIETAAAMQQVANISMQSIFGQLNFTSADFAAIVRRQAGIIREMQLTMQAQGEELRSLKEQYLKQELLNEYKNILAERGIDEKEINNIVNRQMEYVPFDTTSYYAPVSEMIADVKKIEDDNEIDESGEKA